MNWIILVIAGLCEVGFASCLGKAKETSGAESWWWLGGFAVSLTISMVLLYKASQTIPIGTAYAVWRALARSGRLSWASCFSRNRPIFGACFLSPH